MANTATLTLQVANIVKGLLEEANTMRASEEFQRWLLTMAKFHKYSFGNVMLIMIANPNATKVKGFQQWKQLNRFVRRGEKGIPILAPMMRSIEVEKGDGTTDIVPLCSGFKTVYVFDVSQTDGEPLPKAPDWRGEAGGEGRLLDAMIYYARSQDITVEVKDHIDWPNGAAGTCDSHKEGCKAALTIARDGGNLVQSLAHELTHGLGNPFDTGDLDGLCVLSKENKVEVPRAAIESIVESVAAVVAMHYGVETAHKISGTYMGLHDTSFVMQSMEYIQTRASDIIKGTEWALGNMIPKPQHLDSCEDMASWKPGHDNYGGLDSE